MAILRRTTRYLVGTADLIPSATEGEPTGDDDLEAYSDANWAQDTRDRKSFIRGVVLCRGGSPLSFAR